MYTVSILLDSFARKEKIIAKSGEQNIEARHLWKPMYIQRFFGAHDYVGTDIADKLFELCLCLQSNSKMIDEDLEKVCDIVKEVCDA